MTTAASIPASEFRPTPPCPSCGVRMVWGMKLYGIGVAYEVDASAHEPFCPEADKPDNERAVAIRAGGRL